MMRQVFFHSATAADSDKHTSLLRAKELIMALPSFIAHVSGLVLLKIVTFKFLKREIRNVNNGATTLSITAFSIMTLSIKAYTVTLSINDTQDKQHSAYILSVIMLPMAFYILLCSMSS
jgi:hypothetical protein